MPTAPTRPCIPLLSQFRRLGPATKKDILAYFKMFEYNKVNARSIWQCHSHVILEIFERKAGCGRGDMQTWILGLLLLGLHDTQCMELQDTYLYIVRGSSCIQDAKSSTYPTQLMRFIAVGQR